MEDELCDAKEVLSIYSWRVTTTRKLEQLYSAHVNLMFFLKLARPFRPLTRHLASFRVSLRVTRPHLHTRYLGCGATTAAVAAYLAYAPNQIHLDSPHKNQYGEGDTVCMS